MSVRTAKFLEDSPFGRWLLGSAEGLCNRARMDSAATVGKTAKFCRSAKFDTPNNGNKWKIRTT